MLYCLLLLKGFIGGKCLKMEMNGINKVQQDEALLVSRQGYDMGS